MLEELDVHSALLLAEFKDWAMEAFGSCTEAFREALDTGNKKRLRWPVFKRKLEELGFNLRPPLEAKHLRCLFDGLDLLGAGNVRVEDLEFLDRWQPPPWLTA